VTGRLLSLLTALSLLLCVAGAALWVRSYWRYDQVNWFGADNGLNLSSGDGICAVMFGPHYKGPGVAAGLALRQLCRPRQQGASGAGRHCVARAPQAPGSGL
jgi:hypothetical protein